MKNYKHPNGKEHSQYGFRWIHKDGITKKIPGYELDQYINSGWSKGRIFIPTEAFYRSQSKLNKEEIIKLLKEGVSKKKIGELFGVDRGTIRAFIKRNNIIV